MKITITLEPNEVEDALMLHLKKNEELSKATFFIRSIETKPTQQGYIAPMVEVEIELGIPF
jgi:hypothetical protein